MFTTLVYAVLLLVIIIIGRFGMNQQEHKQQNQEIVVTRLSSHLPSTTSILKQRGTQIVINKQRLPEMTKSNKTSAPNPTKQCASKRCPVGVTQDGGSGRARTGPTVVYRFQPNLSLVNSEDFHTPSLLRPARMNTNLRNQSWLDHIEVETCVKIAIATFIIFLIVLIMPAQQLWQIICQIIDLGLWGLWILIAIAQLLWEYLI